MPWEVVQRRLGRAGGLRERTRRQREWDDRYGEDGWCVGYVIDGQLVPQEEAIVSVYNRSYAVHFERHPDDLAELVALAGSLRNPHAGATTGVDLQVPAVLACLEERGLTLRGKDRVDIGSWRGQASHPISVRLSPLHVRCVLDPKRTLESWWQEEKCLAVWSPE